MDNIYSFDELSVDVKMVTFHYLKSKDEKSFKSIRELFNYLWDEHGWKNPDIPAYDEYDYPKWVYEEDVDRYFGTTYAPFIWKGGFMGYIEYTLEAKRP